MPVKGVGSRKPDAAAARHVGNAVTVTPSACTGMSVLLPSFSSCQRTDGYDRQKYRSEGKVHPKGYVEMLERQQRLLISAIHNLYRKQSRSGSVASDTMPDTTPEPPRTQDILQELGLVPPSSSTSQPTSKSPPTLSAESSEHSTVEDSLLELQNTIPSSDQDAPGDDIRLWSSESWLPLLSSHVDGFEFKAGTTFTPSDEAATSAAPHIPQASMISTLARPELTPQDCTMTFHDPLLYRTPWMLDEN